MRANLSCARRLGMLLVLGIAVGLSVSQPCQARPSTPQDKLDAELEKLFETKKEKISRARQTEIEELIKELTTNHPDDRQKNRERLQTYGTDATPFLLRLARSSSHDKSRAALVALAMIKDPASAPFLTNALGDGKNFVTMFAALALGKLGQLESAPPLLAVVLDNTSRDAFDRAAAAVALARIGLVTRDARAGDPQAIDSAALLRLVTREDDTKVIAAVLMALGKIGDSTAYDWIEKQAGSTSDRVRRAAVLALGDLGDARAISVLLERVRTDEDEKTMEFACGALSAFVRDDIAETLLTALGKEGLSHATRAVILRALGAQKPSPAIESVLLKFARSSKSEDLERGAAIASLRAYDGKAVVQALAALLKSEDPKVRSSAIMLLAQKEADPLRKSLRRFLQSEDQVVVETAALALAFFETDKARKDLERVPTEHPAYLFVQNVLRGLEDADPKAYFRSWIDEWVAWLGGTSEALLRNLANEQLYGIFELDRRIIKGAKALGDNRPRLQKALSTAQQDLRLWIEYEPYFDPPRK